MLGSEKETIKYVHEHSDSTQKQRTATHEIKGREPNIEIRLGAIYALEDLANESDSQYFKVIEILAAYVRENASLDLTDVTHELREDINAAITVIGRRKLTTDNHMETRIDLRNVNLRDLELENCSLQNVDFSGSNLSGSTLVNVDLSMAKLKKTNLSSSILKSVSCLNTELTEANLSETKISSCTSFNSDMNDIDFNASRISSSKFISTDLGHSNLEFSTFIDCSFRGSILSNSVMYETEFNKIDLTDAELLNINFEQLHFNGWTKIDRKNYTSLRDHTGLDMKRFVLSD